MTRAELIKQIFTKKSYLCIGLDTDEDLIPTSVRSADRVFDFNRRIIDATHDLCVSYKINTAFYEAMGPRGWDIMQRTAEYIPATHFKIADAKRGDIGNTSGRYAKAFFEFMDFDAVTVTPYMGEDSVRPFLEYPDKWTIVLALTSNKGATDFEMLPCNSRPLYHHVIEKVSSWGSHDNLMFVTGATQSVYLEEIRKMIPDHFLLVPGVGFQGGSLADVSEAAMNNDCGLLINVSRSIIYASQDENFAEEARTTALQYQSEMKEWLEKIKDRL